MARLMKKNYGSGMVLSVHAIVRGSHLLSAISSRLNLSLSRCKDKLQQNLKHKNFKEKTREKTRMFFCVSLFFLFTTGCDNTIEGTIGGPRIIDFQKTEIIAGGPVEADGTSQLLVAIHLKNSDNTPVSNYLVTYTVTSNAGVSANQCTSSDSNGVSICIIKSTILGTKTVTLTNAKVGLSKNIEFIASQGIQRLNILSASQVKATTPQGSKVQVNLGNSVKSIRHQTAGGYEVILSLQGVVQ